MKQAKLILVFALASVVCSCSTLARKNETGVVIARQAYVRSSTAVVAADLKEVNRGDVLDILDSTETEGEQWLRVRTRDAEPIEGWVEARNVMQDELLNRSRQLAKEDDGVPAQASGQLRASSNLRLSPDRTNADNILMRLESGAIFDIIGWKRVPRPKSDDTAESDDAPKAGTAQQSRRKTRDKDAQKTPEEAKDLWYKVRLPPSISPAPAGWIFGRQVELTVPSDIIFYRTGREFVAWQRLDEEGGENKQTATNQDAAKEARPGSWVILEKSSREDANRQETPDFDRIFVLGYDKEKQEHYTAYRSRDIEGYLPLRIEKKSDGKTFTVKERQDGQMKDINFRVRTDDRGMLRVEPIGDAKREGKKR